MLRGVGGLVFVLVTVASLPAAEPFREPAIRLRTVWSVSESFRNRSVPLLARSERPLFHPRRPTFELRLVVDSDDEPVRLIETDQTPPLPGVATLENSEEEVADDDELIVPPQPLSDVAVPIDGAAEKAEKQPKADETKMANNHFSLGGLVGKGDDLGILELESKALPMMAIEDGHTARFDVNFGYAIRWLTGPFVTDLPPRLYTLQLDIGWAFNFGTKLTTDLRITPTWNTDFEKSTQIFRLPWHAVAIYQADTDWRWTAGVMDLDREDIQLLPVAGLTYAPPDGDVLLDLVFPRPKIARRITQTDKDQVWCYVAGELGGGSWAINRMSGARDIITLRDLRLLVGLEINNKKRHASRLEAGWVFDRVVDYRSNLGDYRPPDTAIIRWSSDF